MQFSSGVYCIKCLVNSKIYVGSTNNLKRRRSQHFTDLRGGYHINHRLQGAFNKYGENAFEWGILEYVPVDNLVEREQYWIDFYQSFDNKYGYNICPEVGTTTGVPKSDECRLKISQANSGRKHSQEVVEKNRNAQTGKRHRFVLTDEQVIDIFQRYLSNEPVEQIAKLYNLHPNSVSSIISRRRCKTVKLPEYLEEQLSIGKDLRTCSTHRKLGENHPKAVLSANEIRTIKSRLARGDSINGIATDFGVSPGYITKIKLGYTWKHIQDFELLEGPPKRFRFKK